MCKKVIKLTVVKRDYEKDIASNPECKTMPKAVWKFVQEKMKISVGISSLQKSNGELTTSDYEKANIFNNF